MTEVSFIDVAQVRDLPVEAPERPVYANLLHEDPTSPGDVFLPELKIIESPRNPHLPPLFGEESDKNFALAEGKRYLVREDQLLKALDERTSGVKGGESFILFGYDYGLDRDIAVRVLHKKVDLRANLENFYSTTRLQANLEHHRIVPIIDMSAISTSKGEVFPIAIMPKIEGLSGVEAIKSKQLTSLQIITLLEQIAEALDYMHDRQTPIIHMDVKPGNIMLKDYSLNANDKIDARLLDFGVSHGNIGNDTRKRPLAGYTKSYAAPEVKDKSRRNLICPQSDEYSLAITTLVFFGIYTKFNSEDGTLTKPGDQLNPLPDQYKYLEPIFQKALAFEPSQRYATCGDFISALREKLVTGVHVADPAIAKEEPIAIT